MAVTRYWRSLYYSLVDAGIHSSNNLLSEARLSTKHRDVPYLLSKHSNIDLGLITQLVFRVPGETFVESDA